MPAWMQIVCILLIVSNWHVCALIIKKHYEDDPLFKKMSDEVRQKYAR